MNDEDALRFLISYIRQPMSGGYSKYGYDIYIPNVIHSYLDQQAGERTAGRSDERSRIREISPPFLSAAWDLCRRGIIRPGVARYGDQSTDDGSAGHGFSITPFGRQWVNESDKDDYVPTEPGRFSSMIAPYAARFGPQFSERSQEAIRCYGAHCYLSCCVMCGAATESIMLAVAIAKNEDEAAILDMYNTAKGRSRVEHFILKSASEPLRKQTTGFLALISYWRDQAGHGAALHIGDNEAFTSLATLLRFAFYVNERWDELTAH